MDGRDAAGKAVTMSDKVEYWVDIAEYDLETARAMLDTKRYLYVGFVCHQVIEKMLKAHYAQERRETPPYTHNLKYLAQESGLLELMSEDQRRFLNRLLPLNIEARYPEEKDKLLHVLGQDRCQQILQSTEELKAWIREKLSI